MIETWLLSLWGHPILLLMTLAALVIMGVITLKRRANRARRLRRRVRLGKLPRSYIIHLPANLSKRDDWRVIIAYHPALCSAAFMERTTRLHELPGSENFIVVYPNGFKRTWNAGSCCGPAKKREVDDLGFFDAIMEEAGRLAKIQPKAYVTGYSNGALMTYHLMCRRADRLAAAAPFAAYLPPRDLKDCPAGVVPLLHLHGESDKGAPPNGGKTRYLGELPPVSETIEAIAKRNGCDPVPRQFQMPELDTTCLQYAGPTAEAEASLCIIPKLGHIWPGSTVRTEKMGPARPDLKGSQVILEFFLNH